MHVMTASYTITPTAQGRQTLSTLFSFYFILLGCYYCRFNYMKNVFLLSSKGKEKVRVMF